MRRLKFFLRPGWLILALLVAAFAYLCFSVLAPWQLGKNTKTTERNSLISDSVHADPVPIEKLIGPGHPAKNDEWRRVTVEGNYVPHSDVLVRLRSDGGGPSYEVLTPVTVKDGRNILVDRGFVKPVNGTEAPKIDDAPTGPVKLDARIRMSEGTVPGKDPLVEDGYRQVYFIDSPQVSSVLKMPLVSGYLQLSENQPGGFQPIPLPQLDSGPYLSYGLQWLAFGIMAPLGLAYFVRAELLERRREREDEPEPVVEVPAEADAAESPVPAAAPSAPPTTEQKLADRYGQRR